MQHGRALTFLLGTASSSAAILLGLAVARNCDAPDWTQAAMLTGLPAAAAFGAAGATLAWSRRRGLAILAGAGVGAASWFGSFLLWVGTCSA